MNFSPTHKLPFLIAHRGGVVSQETPENSRAAICRAQQEGYQMVELDIRETADHGAVLLHCYGPAPGTTTLDFSQKRIEQLNHGDTSHQIISFRQGMEICRTLDIGIMLDIKNNGKSAPGIQFLRRIKKCLEQINLKQPILCLSLNENIRNAMPREVILRLTNNELDKLQKNNIAPSKPRFWFGNPKRVNSQFADLLRIHDIQIIPAINTFRYNKKMHLQQAKEDIEKLIELGITHFLIDDIYRKYF